MVSCLLAVYSYFHVFHCIRNDLYLQGDNRCTLQVFVMIDLSCYKTEEHDCTMACTVALPIND